MQMVLKLYLYTISWVLFISHPFFDLCYYFKDFKMFVDDKVYWVVHWSYVYFGYAFKMDLEYLP